MGGILAHHVEFKEIRGVFLLLEYYLQQLDELSRMLVEVQIQMMSVQNNLEKLTFADTVKPSPGTVEFLPGPPQELKIIVDFFPPKIRVHPELLYKKNKQGPSNYSQVRDLWFTTIRNLLMANRDKLSEMHAFSKALVWFTFFFPDDRVRDVDNYAIKLVNDALVKCRLLKDDDHRILSSVIVTSSIDHRYPRTEIVIAEDTGQLEKIQPKLARVSM